MIRRLLAAGFGIAVLFANALPAAARAESQTRFEAASVKPNKFGRGGRLDFLPGGRFVAENLPLYTIIAIAYNVPFQSSSESRLIGAPAWVRSERFDIEATSPPEAMRPGAPEMVREERMRAMLRDLLAERFKLAVRSDQREMPVYAVVVGKNGPKMEPAGIDEKDCVPDSPRRAGQQMQIHDLSCHRFLGGQGRGLHARAASVTDIAQYVGNWTDRPVVDRSGLKGLYRIETEGWVSMRPAPVPPGVEPSPEQLAMTDPGRATLFMIFDRLGLKLEPSNAAIEVYTIEHVERPTEN